MTRTFIQTNEFSKNWEKSGLTDDDMRRLELEILKNPEAGVLIRGTGGLRKLRFAFENQGKSGKNFIKTTGGILWEMYMTASSPA